MPMSGGNALSLQVQLNVPALETLPAAYVLPCSNALPLRGGRVKAFRLFDHTKWRADQRYISKARSILK